MKDTDVVVFSRDFSLGFSSFNLNRHYFKELSWNIAVSTVSSQ